MAFWASKRLQIREKKPIFALATLKKRVNFYFYE